MAFASDSSPIDSRPADAAFETPAVLSMEASGTGPDSYPVEVGLVLPDGTCRCTLIRPPAHWTHWDPRAEMRHRIPRDAAVAHGRDVAEVAAELNALLAGRTVYCDGRGHEPAGPAQGHLPDGAARKLPDEQGWLRRLFDAAGTPPAFHLESLRVLLSDREAAFWHVLQRQVAAEMHLQRHRASADAKIIQLTLLRMRGPLPEPPRG